MKFVLFLLAASCAGIKATKINLEGLLRNHPALRGSFDITVFDINESVESFGYNLITHEVLTEDGYTLELHQIYKGDKDALAAKPHVLLMHDLLGTSAAFVMLGPEKSLAYQLVDAGYDVWLGNNRGNTYCQKHESMDVKNSSFWDFSFHELGVYDSPAIVDHILNESRSDHLSLVGYGQGAAQFLVMIASNLKYNDKINEFVALAPLAYVSHSTHPLVMLLRGHDDIIEGLGLQFNVSDVLDHYDLLDSLAPQLCLKYASLCEGLLFIIEGFDLQELDTADAPTILHVLPGGISVKEVVHYLQLIKSDRFGPFDYGKINNMELYGEINPPNYNIMNITVPVDIFYSQNDLWVSVKDVEELAYELPNSKLHMVDYKYFSHFDYIVGKDTSSLVSFDLINVLNKKNGFEDITSTSTTTTTTTTTTRRPNTKGTGATEGTGKTSNPTGVTTINPDITTEGASNVVQISALLTIAALAGSLFL